MPVSTRKKSPAKEEYSESISACNKCTTSVYYEKSLTKNLGDYNSAKITVGITLPINPTKEDIVQIKSTIEIADDIVTKELEVQVKDL